MNSTARTPPKLFQKWPEKCDYHDRYTCSCRHAVLWLLEIGCCWCSSEQLFSRLVCVAHSVINCGQKAKVCARTNPGPVFSPQLLGWGLREYVSSFLLFKSPPNFVHCGTSHNHRTRFTCWLPKVMKLNNSITNIYNDIFYHVISLSKSTLCFHFHKCTLYIHIFSLPVHCLAT